MKLTKTTIFYSFGLLLLIASCNSNSLSRSNAKDKINDYFNEQNKASLKYSTAIYAVARGEGERYNNELKEIQPYIKAGLLKLKKKDIRPDTQPIYWYVYEITEKGKPYIIKEEWSAGDYPVYYVKTSDHSVNEVTGIKMSADNKEATVDFTLGKENITPFGEAIENSTSKRFLQAYFNLYDDGWRLENIKYVD